MADKKKILPLQYGNAELKKSDRLRLESEFNNIKANGNKFVGRFFILVTVSGNINELKFGIICSRKFSKSAVIRNRARRLLRESFRLLKNQICLAHLIFIPRQKIKKQRLQEVQSEMVGLLEKAGLWKEVKKK